ncbi:MAG: rRNA maturation RNase YbeY [Verrucomicrobiota bacterium]|nr:rRNA maturation RNase YbeY [Verrucomicrobiota bacterium]
MSALPKISVQQRNPGVRMRMGELRAFAPKALAAAWRAKRPRAEIVSADEIIVTLVSDAEMAALHARYSHIAGSTDVLTFQHGEIVISAETAQRQAKLFGSTTTAELRLYLLHGLLHLAGYDDLRPAARAKMQALQERLLRQIG